jgi:hypothetical protein
LAQTSLWRSGLVSRLAALVPPALPMHIGEATEIDILRIVDSAVHDVVQLASTLANDDDAVEEFLSFVTHRLEKRADDLLKRYGPTAVLGKAWPLFG